MVCELSLLIQTALTLSRPDNGPGMEAVRRGRDQE